MLHKVCCRFGFKLQLRFVQFFLCTVKHLFCRRQGSPVRVKLLFCLIKLFFRFIKRFLAAFKLRLCFVKLFFCVRQLLFVFLYFCVCFVLLFIKLLLPVVKFLLCIACYFVKTLFFSYIRYFLYLLFKSVTGVLIFIAVTAVLP